MIQINLNLGEGGEKQKKTIAKVYFAYNIGIKCIKAFNLFLNH